MSFAIFGNLIDLKVPIFDIHTRSYSSKMPQTKSKDHEDCHKSSTASASSISNIERSMNEHELHLSTHKNCFGMIAKITSDSYLRFSSKGNGAWLLKVDPSKPSLVVSVRVDSNIFKDFPVKVVGKAILQVDDQVFVDVNQQGLFALLEQKFGKNMLVIPSKTFSIFSPSNKNNKI